MHLGLLIYGTLETVSGGYLYDRKLVEYLQKQGDTVEIISIPWRNYAAHLTDNFDPALARKLMEFRGDLLIQDELNHPSVFLLNKKIKSILQYPIVSIVHHLRASERHPAGVMPLYRAVERAYLRTPTGFVFNSRTTQRAVESLLGRAVDRSVVAYPSGDRLPIQMGVEDIVRRAHLPGPLQLLFVGNVIPRKGLHVVLAGLKKLSLQDWRLNIVGDLRVASDYIEELKKIVADNGWGEQVIFHGALADAEVGPLARQSHVLVMPSSYEGFGIAYLEGMGFGLPALGTTSGAAGEVITDGKDGFLIPPDDSVALAERLRALNENRGMLAAMSLVARRRYVAHPGWDVSMGQIRAFLGQFLEGG